MFRKHYSVHSSAVFWAGRARKKKPGRGGIPVFLTGKSSGAALGRGAVLGRTYPKPLTLTIVLSLVDLSNSLSG